MATQKPATKKGWMRKQGRTGIYRNWKKRYFILEDGVLSYYQEQDNLDTLKVSFCYIYYNRLYSLFIIIISY